MTTSEVTPLLVVSESKRQQQLLPQSSPQQAHRCREDETAEQQHQSSIARSTTPTENNIRTARRLLYISHLSSQFSEQAWQFGLLLFLTAFTNYTSVLLVSTYGLLSGLVVCLFGPAAGRYFVDNLSWTRLRAAQFLIGTQNLCVLLATICCYCLLEESSQQQNRSNRTTDMDASNEEEVARDWFHQIVQGIPLDYYSLLCILGVHLFGSLAQILDSSFLVAIERDWIVVMDQAFLSTIKNQQEAGTSNGSQKQQSTTSWLSETNVGMKQIDLGCKVVAPAAAGFLIGAASTATSTAVSTNMASSSTLRDIPLNSNTTSFVHRHPRHATYDLANAALLVGFINVLSLLVEYVCTARIYSLVPRLAEHATATHEKNESENVGGRSNATTCSDVHGATLGRVPSVENRICCCWNPPKFIPSGLKIYMQQPVCWAGIGLAMLYLNALTFGSLMTSYLVWRGMRLETVGWWRGVSSAVGLAGTYAFSWLTQRYSLATTGIWSILYQIICISFSFISLFVVSAQFYDVSMALLIGGVCLSRIGLWVFAMTVTQLTQEFIPDGIRGVVGGTQQSLNAFFQLSSFGLSLLFPNPRDFAIYVSAGYAAVIGSAVLFFFGIYFRRDQFVTELEKKRGHRHGDQYL